MAIRPPRLTRVSAATQYAAEMSTDAQRRTSRFPLWSLSNYRILRSATSILLKFSFRNRMR